MRREIPVRDKVVYAPRARARAFHLHFSARVLHWLFFAFSFFPRTKVVMSSTTNATCCGTIHACTAIEITRGKV